MIKIITLEVKFFIVTRFNIKITVPFELTFICPFNVLDKINVLSKVIFIISSLCITAFAST